MLYSAPETELMEIQVERNFLGSAEAMKTVDGSWDEENW